MKSDPRFKRKKILIKYIPFVFPIVSTLVQEEIDLTNMNILSNICHNLPNNDKVDELLIITQWSMEITCPL